MKINVMQLGPQMVLGMRKIGPYKEIPNMIMEIYRYAQSKNIHVSGPPIFLCRECSIETVKEADKKGSADLEIAWPISVKAKGTGKIKCYELPGGRFAHITHRGPYEECEPTYNKLFAWIKKNKLEITGPIREIYPNDPNEVKQEDILTEIYAPIK